MQPVATSNGRQTCRFLADDLNRTGNCKRLSSLAATIIKTSYYANQNVHSWMRFKVKQQCTGRFTWNIHLN